MFSSIPDSVMIFHIWYFDIFVRLQVSLEVPNDELAVGNDLNILFLLSNLVKSCQYTFISDYQVCEVDVLKHPRFCDDFSHLVS